MSQNPMELVAELRERVRRLEARLDAVLDSAGAVRSTSVAATPIHGHSGGGQGGPLNQAVHSNHDDHLAIDTPGTPGAGRARLYAKLSSGIAKIFYRQSDGTEIGPLTGAGAAGAHDHTAGDGSGILTADEHDSYSQYAEIAAPGVPGANKVRIYPKSDGLMYVQDDAGTEREMGTVAHVAAADPHTGYRLESADHTHASTGLQGGALYSRAKYVNVPDAAAGATVVAGDQQGAIFHSGPNAETADALEVDAETAPGASGLPVTWQYGDTNDLDTVASWTTIATYTLSSEKSNRTTTMTNASITANRLIRTNWGTIVGTPKEATTTLHVKVPLVT